LINKNIDLLESNNDEIDATNKLSERFKNLGVKGDISKNEFTEFQKLIIEHKQSLRNENEKVKKRILDLLEEKNKNN